jgi:hypothetical protein
MGHGEQVRLQGAVASGHVDQVAQLQAGHRPRRRPPGGPVLPVFMIPPVLGILPGVGVRGGGGW